MHGPVGSVASTATIWRALNGIDAGILADLRRARAQARDRAWLARGELTGRELPGSRAAGRVIEQVVIDMDATLVTAHSDKQGAAGTFKGGFAIIRSGRGWTTPVRRWPRCCDRVTPAATPPPTTCWCSSRR